MSQIVNSSEWENRWKTIDNVMQSMLDDFAKINEDEKKIWQTTLESSIKCLKNFGEKQFKFFCEGFRDNWLVTSQKYSAEYALRRTIDQISFDLSVLQRAHAQRLSSTSTDQARDALDRADRLAYKALEPAMAEYLNEETGDTIQFLQKTAIITYFQKSTAVRVVPYGPIAIIGIPFSCIDSKKNPQDYLAVAHEVGHYVFWHARVNDTPLHVVLRSEMAEDPAWRFGWLEEIFADVYGCLVAGPLIARDFQDLMYDNLDLYDDDGLHPIAVLRPWIYSETLRQIGEFDISQGALDSRWAKLLIHRVKAETFTPKNPVANEPTVTLENARSLLQETIMQILARLQPLLPNFKASIWSKETDAFNKEQIDKLYDTFKIKTLDRIKKEKIGNAPEAVDRQPVKAINPNNPEVGEVNLPVFRAVDGTVPEPVPDDNTIYWRVGATKDPWLDFYRGASDNNIKLSPAIWSTLLNDTGWAVGGPEGDGNPLGG